MDTTQQIEPVRRSFYDVVLNNLKVVNRKTFVHRLVYIGEYNLDDKYGRTIVPSMGNTIRSVNESYHDEHLTGILVCYPIYFCHVVEGSEDSIIKHLKQVLYGNRCQKYLGVLKVLTCYHHINQRFLPGWLAISGTPLPLTENIDPSATLEETIHHIYTCILQLYRLAYFEKLKVAMLKRKGKSKSPKRGEGTKIEKSKAPGKPDGRKIKAEGKTKTDIKGRISARSRSPKRSKGHRKTKKSRGRKSPQSKSPDRKSPQSKSPRTPKPQTKAPKPPPSTVNYRDCLPPYGLLKFLLSSPYTQHVRDYCNTYGTVLEQPEYKDMVWPLPTEFVPHNIFDMPHDPVPDLPTLIQQETLENIQIIEEK